MGSDLKRRVIIFSAVIVVAILFLLPSISPDSVPETWISKPIKLGLDLSGGVYLVYEVDTEEAVKSRLQTTATAMRSLLRKQKIAVTRARVTDQHRIELHIYSKRTAEKGKALLDEEYAGDFESIGISEEGGRAKLTYGITPARADQIKRESVTQAVETLRERVDQFGVAEPLIQRVAEKRIILQMPGVSDIESVKKVVGSVAKLEFRLVPIGDKNADTIKLKDRFGSVVEVEDPPLMTGDAVADARPSVISGQVEVSLTLTSEGGKTFAKITGDNTGRQLAIVLDGVVYSDPRINERISGGRASITGGFTLEEARQLSVVLRAGALPAPLNVEQERTVGPTLGKESIKKGVLAIIIGFALVIIFMAIYYKKSGVVAVSILGLNVVLVMAALSAFGATLTLPGLAGLALTIGMAVDANVIIFERIREEIRNGSSRDAAVAAGFDKALSAIIDSNVTTLIAGLILYYFGTGPIRGFAVTLSVGILTTIYCATFVARLAFDFFELKGAKQLSI